MSEEKEEIWGEIPDAPTKPRDRSDDITPTQVKDAVERSGFPLELKVLRAFRDARLGPLSFEADLGERLQTGVPFVPKNGSPQHTADIDLTARLTRTVNLDSGKLLVAHIRLFVEVKGMDQSKSAYVAFPWTPPDLLTTRFALMRFGGTPSNDVLRDHHGGYFAPLNQIAQFMGAGFDVLHKNVPVCVQATPVHKGGGTGSDDKEKDDHAIARSVNSMIRAMHQLRIAECQPREVLRMVWTFPILVLGVEEIYLYYEGVKDLGKTQHIILDRAYEVAEGVPLQARMDVVTLAGLPELLQRYLQAAEALMPILKKYESAIEAAADAQALLMAPRAPANWGRGFGR